MREAGHDSKGRKDDGPFQNQPLALLHVNAGMLIERYFAEGDPCIAVWLSRQFRLMSESPQMFDDRLRVMYQTIGIRWHEIGSHSMNVGESVMNLRGEDR